MLEMIAPEVAVAPRSVPRPAPVRATAVPCHEVALLLQGDDNYGVGRVAREIAALLPDIRCVAFCRGTETDDIVAAGVPVHVLSAGEYFRGFAPQRGFLGAARQLVRAQPHWRRCARELHAWCQRESVRVLHGNVWAHYLTLGALRNGFPGRYRTIWHTHNFLNVQRNLGLRGRFNQWLVRRGADCLLCVSHAVAGGWGRSGVPTRVVHNCIGSRYQFLPPVPTFTTFGPERPLRLVGAGRMEWSKGHHVSVEAVALLRDAGLPVTLDLFGGPLAGNSYFKSLQGRIEQLQLADAVTIRGYADDFVHRLAGYDIALQSRIDPEPCSLFVLECMNRALPLVASAGGGTPELLRDEREGCLYPPGEAGALARAVGRLARDPAFAHRLATNARARVAREFSPERFARKLSAVYAEVLAAAPARPHRTTRMAADDDALEGVTTG